MASIITDPSNPDSTAKICDLYKDFHIDVPASPSVPASPKSVFSLATNDALRSIRKFKSWNTLRSPKKGQTSPKTVESSQNLISRNTVASFATERTKTAEPVDTGNEMQRSDLSKTVNTPKTATLNQYQASAKHADSRKSTVSPKDSSSSKDSALLDTSDSQAALPSEKDKASGKDSGPLKKQASSKQNASSNFLQNSQFTLTKILGDLKQAVERSLTKMSLRKENEPKRNLGPNAVSGAKLGAKKSTRIARS